MTDAAVQEQPSSSTAPAERMAWDSGLRRFVVLYLPLRCAS